MSRRGSDGMRNDKVRSLSRFRSKRFESREKFRRGLKPIGPAEKVKTNEERARDRKTVLTHELRFVERKLRDPREPYENTANLVNQKEQIHAELGRR